MKEFRRIDRLPPYVFSVVNDPKAAARRAGEDVVDLGMGNPDLASPEPVVDKLAEAARDPRNHRYSTSRGLPNLRRAIAKRYEHRYGVRLDPETEVVVTMGAKEAIGHIAWTLVAPGDTCLVPEPTYPIHTFSVALAGADVRSVPLGADGDFFSELQQGFERTWPRPRLIITSFPHNPTTSCIERSFFEHLVAFAREHDIAVIHDLRLRRPVLRRLPGAELPRGARHEGSGRRGLLDVQVVLDAGMAPGVRRRQSRDGRGADSAEELPGLRRSSRSRSPRSSRSTSARTVRRSTETCTGPGATR